MGASELLSAINIFQQVHAGDLSLVHDPKFQITLGEVPQYGAYSYIPPTQDYLDVFINYSNFHAHGCMDKRVVAATHNLLAIDGRSKTMTTSAGGAEQWDNSTRFTAEVLFLSQLRIASVRNPKLLLMVHEGGILECGGFRYMAGEKKVASYKEKGEVKEQIVWRAKKMRDAIWSRSKSVSGDIDVACALIGSNDEFYSLEYQD